MIYYASESGAHHLVQKWNLELAAQELALCESRGEIFIYVVPACIMFDFHVPGKIVESTPRSTQGNVGAVTAVAEDMILESDMGYILRVMPFLDKQELIEVFEPIHRRTYNGQKIHDVLFQFSSRHAVAEMARTMSVDRTYAESVGRVRHVFGNSRISTSYIFFRLLEEEDAAEVEFDPDGLTLFPVFPASLCSEHGDAVTSYVGQFNFRCGLEELETLKSSFDGG